MIFAQNLTKVYGKVRALDGFDMTVEAGEVHGFLGPNGAGKSTTIRAILGQISLDGGSLSVGGLEPRRDAVEIHRNLAYVPGDVVLWPGLTGGQTLDMLGSFHPRDNRDRRQQLISDFDLDVSKKGRSYSKGNRQKVALISALSADVDLYIFDEPTSGLDPLMEAVFQEAVRDRIRAGATVLLSSHILDEVDALCSHVTIIRDGTRVAYGSLDEIRASTTTTIDARFARQIDTAGLSRFGEVVTDSGHVRLSVRQGSLNEALSYVASLDPQSMSVRPPSLDEVFASHYGAA